MNYDFYAFMKTWWDFGGEGWFCAKASRIWPLDRVDTPECRSYSLRVVSISEKHGGEYGTKAVLIKIPFAK